MSGKTWTGMSPTGGRTAIIDMAPGRIRFRGHPIEELIGASPSRR
jgi:hypothetical protein